MHGKITTFRISAASGLMNTLIFICQIATAPVVMRLILVKNHTHLLQLKALAFVFDIWNLNFFRSLYPPFCLHPVMTTVQALALDIKLSLIDAFATFLLLSFVKFNSVSFDLLVPTQAFNIHGEPLGVYLFYDGTMEYFGKEHLPYGFLALVAFLVLNIFPLLLLCLYPCRCFQRYLNRCNLRSHLLHTLMDAFQGHYKDGTIGTRDCRYFSALYLLVRMCFLIEGSFMSFSNSWLLISVSLLLVVLFLNATFHPYKSPIHNNIDIFLLIISTLLIVSIMGHMIFPINNHFAKLSEVMTGILCLILFAYSIGFLFYKMFIRVRCVQKICQNIRAAMPCHCHEDVPQDFDQVFPYRMIHDEEYVHLSDEPHAHDEERNLISY